MKQALDCLFWKHEGRIKISFRLYVNCNWANHLISISPEIFIKPMIFWSFQEE